jgi:HSP20 family protein
MFWPILESITREMDAFGEFGLLQAELENHFQGQRRQGTTPAVNIYGNDTEVVVKAEMPGVSPDEIKLTVEDRVLTLVGERKSVALGEEDAYLHRELETGAFKRTIRLPFEVKHEGVTARHANGVLTVTLPRADAAMPRTIPVNEE